MKTLTVIFDRAIDLASGVAGAGLLFLTVIVTLSVVLRHGCGIVLFWLPETSALLLALICFLLATWVLKREQHVTMNLVIGKLNPRAQDAVGVVTSILMALISLAVAWYGVKTSLVHFQKGLYVPEVLNIPTGVYSTILALGFVLLFIQSIRRARGYVNRFRVGKSNQ